MRTQRVPPISRWPRLRDEAHSQVGNELNKALLGLSDENSSLSGVLEHIDFNRKVGQSQILDGRLRELIKHFSKVRLLDEDFEFPDLLGAAYEYLIKEFADSAGKKGGEFYTPRDVVRIMVELLDPQPGMRIYDPCCTLTRWWHHVGALPQSAFEGIHGRTAKGQRRAARREHG